VFAARPCEAEAPRNGDGQPTQSHAGMWVLVAAIVGSSMAMIDGTAVNVALPLIQKDFNASSEAVQWIVEGYLLFLSALILIGGALGDRFGRKRVFGIGIGVFAGASLWCAVAPSIGHLIVARCVQGIGGALATPGSLALISANFSGAARGRAIGTWSGFSAITTAIGPVLGGALAQAFSWRAVFFINIPLAAFVVIVLVARVPESRDPSAAKDVDLVGAILATLGLGALVYGLVRMQGGGLDLTGTVAVVAGLVLLVGFVLYERVARNPMMHLDLFRNRMFAVTNLYTLFLYAALGGSLYFVPFNLLNVQGYTPTAAGAALLPFIVIMFTLSRFSGGLVARVGVRAPLVVGAFIAGLGFVAYAMTGVGHSYWVSFFPAAVILGFGGAAFVAPLTTAVMGAVSEEHAGIASGVNNAIARTAGLIAIAVLGIALAATFESQLGRALSVGNASPATLASVARNRASIVTGRVPDDITDGAQRDLVHQQIALAYTDGFRSVMLISAALAWLAGLMAWFFLPPMAPTKQARSAVP
jgi:EmrB/QacA subfamily drug resistance transporter